MRPRSGCSASASAMQAAPTASAAPFQPNATTMGGTSAPASAPPAGTPVCLIEKTIGIHLAGVTRASTCELAGVGGP